MAKSVVALDSKSSFERSVGSNPTLGTKINKFENCEKDMLECLILGDSIAVGTKMFRPECVDYTQGGITSHGWNRKFSNKDLRAQSVIISLSTNDYDKADTYGVLMDIRTKIHSKNVYWILPNEESKPDAVKHVKRVAQEFNDVLLTNTRWQKDKIHPSWAGYKQLAEKTK